MFNYIYILEILIKTGCTFCVSYKIVFINFKETGKQKDNNNISISYFWDFCKNKSALLNHLFSIKY